MPAGEETYMKYTKLGCSDLTVSRICMGCMGFGDPGKGQHSWTLDEGRSREIIKHGLEQGVNFYDTAVGYQGGTSEQYVGRALRDFAGREEVVVATKFTPRTKEEAEKGISGQEHIERMLNRSLKNLGMDYVDLYIYHMWDYQTPLYEIMDGLDRMVKGIEREMIPYCREENIALTPYSALAGGRLSKRPGEISKRLEEDSYARLKYDGTARQDQVVIGRVVELADKYGVSMTEVALAWLLEKVTAPVVGMTKIHHMENAVKAVDFNLTSGETEYLEEAYVPHRLVGVMAQNTREASGKEHVWSVKEDYVL